MVEKIICRTDSKIPLYLPEVGLGFPASATLKMNIQSCRNPNTIIFTKTVKHFGHFYIYWKIKGHGNIQKKEKKNTAGKTISLLNRSLGPKVGFSERPTTKEKGHDSILQKHSNKTLWWKNPKNPSLTIELSEEIKS